MIFATTVPECEIVIVLAIITGIYQAIEYMKNPENKKYNRKRIHF